MLPIKVLGVLLFVACLVAMLSRRLRLPYSVGLVAAGLALSFAPLSSEIPLSRDLIFNLLLPPLVFEAALQLEWKRFSRELPLTATLAFFGVPVAAAFIAAAMHFGAGWSWIGAGLFGMLIAATDPVSVIATFKEQKADPRLSMVVESESLLNDGAAAVGFGILVAIVAGQDATPVALLSLLAWTVLGALLAGGIVAGIILLIAGRTEDHLVELTLTTIAAFASFMVAEHFHASGVLATLTAGLIVGNVGWRGAISEGAREHVTSYWEYVAFLANSVIFLVIGIHEAHQPFALLSWPIALALAATLLGRSFSILPLSLAFQRTRLSIDRRFKAVLVWGGLRGALALALALAVPEAVPERLHIIVTAFAVVAFSVFVQGLTMPTLLRRLGLLTAKPNPRRGPRSALE
jgi:monovalent cation:H+ antiporter, CPA1 family